MRAAVLAVGTELLLGDVVNSNAAWLGGRLAASGCEVVSSAAVADDLTRLVPALRDALAAADVVVLCGGLGPTLDDLTREAIAAALDVPLARDAEVEEHLRTLLAPRFPDLPEEVFRQADVPAGAEVLRNPAGTAPGLWLERDGRVVVALPGPPHELRAVSEPIWERLAARSGTTVVTRQVLVAGVPESLVAQRVEAVVALPAGVRLSYLAGSGVVRVRFTGTEPALLAPLVAAVDVALGDDVLGHDAETPAGVVHALLAERGQTLAVAESLTGGLLSAALTEQSGASLTFRGAAVVYATDLKESLVGVPAPLLAAEGPVSADAAAALAAGARDRLGADWGLAVTGVAGPTEQDGVPVGTVFAAVAGPHGGQVRRLRLPGDRARVRLLTTVSALDLLRRHLEGKIPPG
jgi:nicotinamide-nucleotide amidase